MKILIIGGKKFLGYHAALEATKRGHSVTLFNRGKTNTDLLPHIPSIIGDRNTDTESLNGMKFDAVIDTCAYFPSQIEKTAKVLGDNINKYMLISSISACDMTIAGLDENDPVCGYDFASKEITPETYGPLKAACEKQLTDMLGIDKSLVIRPGYIVGDRDPSDRFTYWPVIMEHMDEMLVPETGELGFQYIDVRDLVIFMIDALEKELSGTYNVTGPADPIKFSEFVEVCHQTINQKCKLIKVDDKWLTEHDLLKFIEFPLCDDIPEYKGAHNININKAISAGLQTRPLNETLVSTLAWYHEHKYDAAKLAVGLKPEKMQSYIDEMK